MNIRLLRHGETEWNSTRRIQGQQQIGLNENGIKQAEAAAKRLKSEKVDVIYSSDLLRCYQTAEIVNGEFSVEIIKTDALREMSYGDWETRLWKTIYGENELLNGDWRSQGMDFTSPGGESAYEFRTRVTSWFRNWIFSVQLENVLIVSHEQVMKMIISCFREVEDKDIFSFIRIENCQDILIQAEEIKLLSQNEEQNSSINNL